MVTMMLPSLTPEAGGAALGESEAEGAIAQEEEAVEPEGEVVPLGHSVQLVAPALIPYVPAAQRVQAVALLPLNEPAEHCKHDEEVRPPVGLYWPAAQL